VVALAAALALWVAEAQAGDRPERRAGQARSSSLDGTYLAPEASNKKQPAGQGPWNLIAQCSRRAQAPDKQDTGGIALLLGRDQGD
jgi:hypothetical protein